MLAVLQRLAGALGLLSPSPAPAALPAEDLVVQREFKAVDDLRTLCRWLLTIFAAVAALLIAGVQVSSIGHLSLNDPRLWFAVVCGALTLVSIAVILATFVRVLTPATVNLKALADLEAKNPNHPDIRYLIDGRYLGDRDRVSQLYTDYQQPNASAALSLRVDRVNATVLHHRTDRLFMQALRVAIPMGLVTALFIAGFVWAANPPASAPGSFSMPTEATLRLDAPGKAALSDIIGPSCVTSDVDVIVLAVDNGVYDVVSTPSDRCKLARFSVGSSPLGVEGTLIRKSQVAVGSISGR